MLESNIYHASCVVLLQAVLAHACRAIFAFCIAIGKDILLDERVVGIVSSYVATSEAFSLIEQMDKYTLLTALHLVCCEYSPYFACNHSHGEFAAAVSAVLEDSSVRSHLLSVITEFIMRKWRGDREVTRSLLFCAVSVGPEEHRIVFSLAECLSAPVVLLTQIYPELSSGGPSAAFSCGCPHKWFRETLPIVLLETSMGQHARLWQRTSVLRRIFLRWRQCHGMFLLRGLAAGNSQPFTETNIKALRTVSEKHTNLPAKKLAGRVESESNSYKTEEKKQDINENGNSKSGDDKLLSENSVAEKKRGAVLLPLVTPTNVLCPELKNDTTPNLANLKGKEPQNDFFEQCSNVVLLRLKRHVFRYWRDTRLVEQQKLRRVLDESKCRIKLRYWAWWKWRLRCRCNAKNEKTSAEKCCAILEAKKLFCMQRIFVHWKLAFMVRHFRKNIYGYRLFCIWHSAYIFTVHAIGKAKPFISNRRLALNCLKHWREKYCNRVADRLYTRFCFLLIVEKLRRKLDFFQRDNVSKRFWRQTLQRRCLCNWRKAYKISDLCTRFAKRSKRRFLYHVFLTWHVQWRRQINRTDRMHTFFTVQKRRLVVFTFATWHRKTQLRLLQHQLKKYMRRRTFKLVWVRWVQRVVFCRRLQSDRIALAGLVRQRLLLRGAWRMWRRRCVLLEMRRFEVAETARLAVADAARERRLLAATWFAWRGKTHLRRRGRSVFRVHNSLRCADTSLGVNRSCPRTGAGVLHPSGISVSFAGLTCSPHTRDNLGSLRVERMQLRDLDSSRWRSMAHSRLFNDSKNSSTANAWGSRNYCNQSRKCGGEVMTTVFMAPSDVEEDNSPSADNSEILL